MRGTHVSHTDTNRPDGTDEPGPDVSSEVANGSSQSLASCVQRSAAHLARSAFEGTSDAARTLANATSEKTTGSGSGSGSGSATISSVSGSGFGDFPIPTRQVNAKAGGLGTFRSPGTRLISSGGFTLPSQTEEQFQLGDLNRDMNLQLVDNNTDILQSQTGNWKGKQRAHDPKQIYNTAWERSTTSPLTQKIPEPAQSTDGTVVVSLLSDPSFDPIGFAEPSLDIEFDPAASPPLLSADEMRWLESWRREVSPDHEHGPRNVISSLSLVPDIDTFLQQNNPTLGTDEAIALRDAVLERLSGATDWVGVQDRYHDEVWGYLRPELEAAKVEIEENMNNGLDEDGPAVRRLKMILGHMRSPS
ncbi:hypothetical protein N7495_004720 [Penicillium taxi]|uniref:uncharacterized protein n=1 Tax=Penicillium taxi TaxID=168475 RepID=UPI002545ABD7|nr:uncharacterized protein N7495_004720 [Penicillium taxi]KAJ5899976.1 hypothetical protein N7495_004720 [Penicillium taxi]